MDPRERFLAKTRRQGDCLLWTASTGNGGYGVFWFDGRLVGAHRASYALFVGDPTGHDVCHRCDTPGCVEPTHLFLGDAVANMQDAARKGRVRARLSDDEVRAVRSDGRSSYVVAAEYGISQRAVMKIRQRASYAWLD